MTRYDPERAPDPEEWLLLDEQERILLVERHHRRARVELPNPTLHSIAHAIVENQLALGIEPIVQTLARLISEGLTRHDAVHAIGLVVSEHMLALMKPEADGSTAQASIEAAVVRIDARVWL